VREACAEPSRERPPVTAAIVSRWRAGLCPALVAVAVVGAGCDGDEGALPPEPRGGVAPAAAIEVRSDAFGEGEPIPVSYTCDGEDVSPPLVWSGVPVETGELVLVMEDPDAPRGTFTHWLVAGLDPATDRLEEGRVPAGAVGGRNDFGSLGYNGPCPPEGDDPHRYVFTLVALAGPLDRAEGFSADVLRTAVERAELARGRLTGTYGR
jgi:Raf kinase inhibitor-like YbhB/YbcL family protein